jgi:hypothetical protein
MPEIMQSNWKTAVISTSNGGRLARAEPESFFNRAEIPLVGISGLVPGPRPGPIINYGAD